jgi:hypothetical protein
MNPMVPMSHYRPPLVPAGCASMRRRISFISWLHDIVVSALLIIAGLCTSSCVSIHSGSAPKITSNAKSVAAHRRACALNTEESYYNFLASAPVQHHLEIDALRADAYHRLCALADDRITDLIVASNRLDWLVGYINMSTSHGFGGYGNNAGLQRYKLKNRERVQKSLDNWLSPIQSAIISSGVRTHVEFDLPPSLSNLNFEVHFARKFSEFGWSPLSKERSGPGQLVLDLQVKAVEKRQKFSKITYQPTGAESREMVDLVNGFDLVALGKVRWSDGPPLFEFKAWGLSVSTDLLADEIPQEKAFASFVSDKGSSFRPWPRIHLQFYKLDDMAAKIRDFVALKDFDFIPFGEKNQAVEMLRTGSPGSFLE